MLDWLAFWGATQAVGLIVKPILEDLVKEAGKDWAKDFLKGIPSKILDKLNKDDREIAAAKALKEFLQLMQQDLEDSGLSEDDIKKYKQPIKHYLKNQEVKENLGNAFKDDAQTVNINKLVELWDKLNPAIPLPDDFNWKRLGKKYVQKVKEIILEFPELRQAIDSKNIEQIKEYTKETARIIPEFDLQRYQEGIRERYGNLKLDSLDTSGYAYNELKLWRIFIAQNVREVPHVLPQVHELPKEHLKRLRKSDQLEAELQAEELENHKRVYLEQPIRLVLDVVNDRHIYKYIVILGNPGAGKSTLLQFLALNWADSPLDNTISQAMPLLIELRIYMRRREDKECHNFLEFFHNCSGAIAHLNQHQLHEQLKAGNAVVMFDGLDEVFDAGQREDVITDIHRFTNEYANVQVIVTSRIIGYKPQRLRDAEFHHFMLQDLDLEQIQDFIHRWHELTFNDEADKVKKRERLQRAIETSKSIAELAGNPLLLTMMAILNRNQELPRDRPELYNQASRLLLHQWDVERALVEDQRLDPKTIDYKDKQAMLRQVAYFMQTSDKGLAGNLINVNDLERIMTGYLKSIEVSPARGSARLIINQLRTRNFILCSSGADYYAFVHRTFLEYFCAWEFVWRFEKERSITIEDLKSVVFAKHWQDENWHEVLVLIAGMIEPTFVGEILEYLMLLDGEEHKFINLFLAAKCLAEVRNRSVIVKADNKLLNQIQDLTKYGDIINIYLKVDREDLEKYQEYVNNNYSVQEIRTKAITAVVMTWQDDSKILPWLKERATSDEDNNVRYVAVKKLASLWKSNVDIKALLKERVTSDEDGYVRCAALEELSSGWKYDPDIKDLLQESNTDSCEEVREFTLKELARFWKEDPDTLSIIKERAVLDFPYVQQTAIQELIRGWKYDPNTLPFLKQLAANDKEVRQRVVDEIFKGYKDNPEVLCWLAEYTRFDHILNHHSNVTLEALKELVRSFKDDIYTKAFLEKHATSNEDESELPVASVRELARAWKDDPDTLIFLKNLATKDGNSYVQSAAVQELAHGWKENPDTLTFLKKLATSDKSSIYVQSAAVQELAHTFNNEPGMFEFLRYVVVNQPSKSEDLFGSWSRQVVLKVIIKEFPQHPQTLPLLRDRAENDPDRQVRDYAQKQLNHWEGRM
ncbi:HEAT repeat domain-containing protein [Nostoc sp. UHCC 0870]|uniref:HEAT repeat domain-containing protein n=1 Tax=Nostoc sp. UHCC 0870 TaxID=2914041 RepID=UPI001EDED310|nr:HEAT repeat domain-containing protein [Nostoc sp. UHCC 0870]UKO97367.1 HEAT repeat domain-containing protein [Nostoc sp. UHCC 0870]